MRIAVIRGQHLNQWEMQSYESLDPKFNVTAFASFSGLHSLEDLRIPVRRLPSLDPLMSTSLVGAVLVRPVLWRLGMDNRLFGLERSLAGFDIVHAAESTFTFTRQAVHGKQRSGYRLVATCWETIPFLGDHIPFVYRRKRVVLPQIDRFIAMTARAAAALRYEGVPDEKIRVILPGIDLDHFKPLTRTISDRLGIWRSPESFRILFVGRIDVSKGLRDLLIAVSFLRGRIRKFEVAIVGNGNRFLVDSIAGTLGIGDVVTSHIGVPYSDMPDLYASADVFVAPSIPTPLWEEQFGMVLAESLACGKAVVTTRSGAIPEVVGDAAVLVPPYDPAALAEAISELAMNSSHRRELMGRSVERARQCFDSRRFAQELGEVYMGLVGQ